MGGVFQIGVSFVQWIREFNHWFLFRNLVYMTLSERFYNWDEIDTLISNEGIKCSVDSRVQSLNLVSESGLYDLIMQSRKPEAKAFKRWVTSEVLPSICKTG